MNPKSILRWYYLYRYVLRLESQLSTASEFRQQIVAAICRWQEAFGLEHQYANEARSAPWLSADNLALK